MLIENTNLLLSLSIGDYRPEKFRSRKVLPRADIIEGRLPRGKVILFAGQGGVGKSMVLLHLFAAISQGEGFFFGGQALGGPQSCLVVFAEDDSDTISRRLQIISKKELPNSGLILPMPDIEMGVRQLFAPPYPSAAPEPTQFFNWLDQTLEMETSLNGKLGFLALDPFAALFGVDENKSSDVQSVWAHLTRLAVKFDLCIIVTHHLRKGSNQSRESIRGSSALVDGVRAAYVMTKEDNPNEVLKQTGYPVDASLEVLYISPVKDNLGLKRGRITLIRNVDGSLVDVSNKVQDWINAEDAILKIVSEKNAVGSSISKTGKNGLFNCKCDTWPASIKDLAKNKIETKAQTLIEQGKLILIDGKLYVTSIPEELNV